MSNENAFGVLNRILWIFFLQFPSTLETFALWEFGFEWNSIKFLCLTNEEICKEKCRFGAIASELIEVKHKTS